MKQTVTFLAILSILATTSPAQQVAVPYFDDFESGATGWIASVPTPCGTNWELGSPSIGFTLGAYSGQYCWDVNLNAAYSNNAICYLSTPVFDFTTVPEATISFWVMYNSEYMWDYLSVQVTVDRGDTWQYMPFPYLISPEGGIQKWIRSAMTVSNLFGNSEVQFRFVFISDGSVAYDGYSLDDFRITVNPLGLNAAEQADVFSVYPNPSNGKINFRFDPTIDKNATIVIYSTEGKKVFEQDVNQLVNTSSTEINLPSGIYSAVYENNESRVVKRVVVTQQ